MTTKLESLLESTMDEWLETHADSADRPEVGLIHPELASQMASAAAAVFDACFDGQKYYQKEMQ